jgi:hypothetical protein
MLLEGLPLLESVVNGSFGVAGAAPMDGAKRLGRTRAVHRIGKPGRPRGRL